MPDDRPIEDSLVATERDRPGARIVEPSTTASLHDLASGSFAAKSPTSSEAPYNYSSLNEDLNEIRLLTLHEGDFKADISISIHTVPLMPDNPPIYEALSYVWGSTENPVDIQVGPNTEVCTGRTNFGADLRTIAVTRNLAEALPYLRYTDRPRILWIDAICVNQQDSKERGLQVKRMGNLYRLADRVVVWLGPEKNDSGWGIRILDQLSSQIKVNFTTFEMEPASDEAEPHWSDIRKRLPYGDGELLAIDEVLRRPWFERLWIQQEIRLAKRNAIFLCGLDMIAWQSLRLAIIPLLTKVLYPRPLSPGLSGLEDRVRLIASLTDDRKTFALEDVMRLTFNCKCFDPRDRIYAVLSLLNDNGKLVGIEVDYKKKTNQVYQDVALRYIAHYKSLNVLISSGLKDKPSGRPTWVPDWTVANPFLSGEASGYSISEVRHRGSGVLSVTGTHLATVQHAKRIKMGSDIESVILEIQRLAPHGILERSYPGRGSVLAAYCHTICADRFSDGCLPLRKDFPQFQQSMDFLSTILQPAKNRNPDTSPGSEASKFLLNARHFCKQKSFIETCEGYIGLAPQIAQPGDHVCVLLGCDVPMLLRPAPNLRYQVVGACFIHGLMQGEAFLGPFPDHYQSIRIMEEGDGVRYNGFLNRQTGKTQYRDPRYEAPLENDDGDHFMIWKYPDGSQSRRLTAKMLEGRGVKLQNFDLI